MFGVDPDVCVSGVLNPTATAKKVAGGYRITGTWHYNSGGWHAQWAVLGMPIVNGAGETIDQGLALIPMTDLERVDTWFVAGMKSSGSICLKANDIFIPDHRILSVPRAIEGDYPTEMRSQEAFYRSAFVPLLAIILVGPILGLGRAALEFVRQKAGSRTIAYTFFEKQTSSVGLPAAGRRGRDDDRHGAPARLSGRRRRRQRRRARRLSRYVHRAPGCAPTPGTSSRKSRRPSTSCCSRMARPALPTQVRSSAYGATRRWLHGMPSCCRRSATNSMARRFSEWKTTSRR